MLMLDAGYIYMLIGMVGTTIAPWMQFYLQAAVVEKGITAKEYAESRLEVIVGCIMTDVIAFFIIVACAGAICSVRPQRHPAMPPRPRSALKPFGQYAVPAVQRRAVQRVDLRGLHPAALHGLFGVRRAGLRSRREQAACSEAPVFYWLYTAADRGRRGRDADSRTSRWCR